MKKTIKRMSYMVKTKYIISSALAFMLLALCLFCGCSRDPVKLEGELIEINSSSNSSEPITDFYCSGKINKEIENDQDCFFVELSFGVVHLEYYDDINKKYITISVYNELRENYLIKKIPGSEFFSNNYLCYQTANGMHFNHSEVIKIPTKLLVNDKGCVTISVSGYSTENSDLAYAGDAINIYYIKTNSKIYFNNIYFNNN